MRRTRRYADARMVRRYRDARAIARYYKDSARLYRDFSSVKEAAALASKMSNKASRVVGPSQAGELRQLSAIGEDVAAGRGNLNALIDKIKSVFSMIPNAFKSVFQKIHDALVKLRAKIKANPVAESNPDMKQILANLQGKGSNEMKNLVAKLTKNPPKSMREIQIEIENAKGTVPKDELRELLKRLQQGAKKSNELPFAGMAI